MKWEEWLKTEGVKEGELVWICDYRFDGLMINKPIRHIKPTNVSIVKSQFTYYSDWYFRKLKKNGDFIKKDISPYDNTGLRSRRGVAVQIFRTEKEAKDYYTSTCLELQKKLIKEAYRVKCEYAEKLKELKGCR